MSSGPAGALFLTSEKRPHTSTTNHSVTARFVVAKKPARVELSTRRLDAMLPACSTQPKTQKQRGTIRFFTVR